MVTVDDQLVDLLGRNANLFTAYEEWSSGQAMLLAGSVDDPDSFDSAGGKTGARGYYPVTNASGATVFVPCIDRLSRMPDSDTASLEATILPVGRLTYDRGRRALRVGDGLTPGGRYQAHILRVYANDLGGVVEGAVSAAQRSVNTGAINTALAAGQRLHLRRASLIEIDTSLIARAAGAGLIADEGGTRPIIRMPAASFTNASLAFADRHGTRSVGINASGTGSATADRIMLAGFALECERLDGRVLRGIAARNVRDLLIDDVEVYGLPTGVGFALASMQGNSRLSRLWAHDFSDTTDWGAAPASPPQLTGIEIDNDIVGGIPSTGWRLSSARVEDITVSGAFLTRHRDQCDGLNIARLATGQASVDGLIVRNVDEAVDCFGCNITFAGVVIEDARTFGIKFVHGASRNTVTSPIVRRAGLAALAFQGSNDVAQDTAGNLITGLQVEDIDPAGRWAESQTAAVRITDNGGTKGLPRRNSVIGAEIGLGSAGKHGWYDESNGSDNIGAGVAVRGTAAGMREVTIANSASKVSLARSALLDMTAHGVVADGVTDCTAYIQRAIDKAASLGLAQVLLPPGDVRIDGKVTVPFDIRVSGAGQRRTRLVVYGKKGIEFAGGSDNGCACISDLTIAARSIAATTDADDAAAGYGLKITGLRSKRQTASIRRVRVESLDGTARSWGFDRAIWYHDLIKGAIDDCFLDGRFNTAAPASAVGQSLQTAIVGTGQSTEVIVKDTVVTATYRGMLVSGGLNEGVHLTGAKMVGVYFGIDAPSYGKPGFWITDTHINAVRRGVFIEGSDAAPVVDVSIAGLYLYRSAAFAADGDWTGVHLKKALARTSIERLHTSLSNVSTSRVGLRLEDCTGVTATQLMLSQADQAIYHVGTNAYVIYNDVMFNGLTGGGFNGVGLTLTSTDNQITMGRHNFQGSVATKYIVPGYKQSVRIDTGQPRYAGVLLNQTVTEAGTQTFKIGLNRQMQGINFAAGAAAYTFNLDFDTADALMGDYFDLALSIPTSINPTVVIRSGLGGTVLKSLTSSGTSRQLDVRLAFDGTAWAIVNLVARAA